MLIKGKYEESKAYKWAYNDHVRDKVVYMRCFPQICGAIQFSVLENVHV